jgi:cytochrome c-type protein NapB
MKFIGLILLLGAMGVIGCQGEPRSKIYKGYERAAIRYYAYAPPTIPHDVLNPKCLDCHERGLVVDGRKAPITPHPELVNCLQCHIRPDENVKPFRENLFVGLPEPKSLPLLQPAGPPLTPHRLFMRENCLVCHGDATRKEITQTTHPERSNCLQCHIPQDTAFALMRRTG